MMLSRALSRSVVERLWVGLLLASIVNPCTANPFADAQYEFGHGLTLPDINLTLSGYSSVRARNLENADARADWRDLSLFLRWQPATRWTLFSEIEMANALVLDERGLSTGDIEVEAERLYVDFAASRAATLRTGRFLTPFGRWNQVHADPLVWTVSRPLVTSLLIPDHGTGLALLQSFDAGDDSIDLQLFVDDSDDFDPVNGKADFEDFDGAGLVNDFEYAGGGQVRYHLLEHRAEVALSYATYEFANVEGQAHALGIDGLLRWRRMELSFEAGYRHNAGNASDDWGAFAQGAFPLREMVFAITRIEYYRSDRLAREAARATCGLAWRPLAPVNVKLEYHAGTDRQLAPDGIELSLSVLF